MMKKNLYEILGLDLYCSKIEIKSAYKKLAIKLHPDLNPNNKKAEEEFRAINQAYRILYDNEKRKEYNQKLYKPKAVKTNLNMFDVLNFKQYSYYKPKTINDNIKLDLYKDLEISFTDSIRGKKEIITLANNKVLEVIIPAGITNGTYIKLKGQGRVSTDGMTKGDAYLKVHVKKHKYFKTDGLNIYLDLEISDKEAKIGKTLPIYTISDIVNVEIPPNSKNGDILRIRNKGVRKNGATGDQIITIKISKPKDELTRSSKINKNLYEYESNMYH